MKKSKESKRITWRVILIMLFFNVLIIGAIIAFVFAYSLVNSGMRGQYVIDGIGGRMESMVKGVAIAARNNVDEVEASLDSPEKVFDALEHELRLNNHYIGLAAAFVPDYYPNQGRWYEPYVKLVDSTHIERKQIGSAQHDYFIQEWYVMGMHDETEQGYLSDPYYDADGGMSLLCSYILPIHNAKGRKVGLYCIDLSLDWLSTIIEEDLENVRKEFMSDSRNLKESDDKPYFSIQIIDSKGQKIIGSDSLDTSILNRKKKDTLLGSGMMNLTGTPYYIHSRQLEGTDWTLVVFQHNHLVYMWGTLLALIIFFFMTLSALAIFFFMHRSIRHLSKELKETATSKATIESELNIAHQIQMAMLPKTFPAFPHRDEIEIYGKLTPAKSVGGDLFDFFLRNDELFFCIGDVSGKGVPASLVMAVSRTMFRNVAVHVEAPHLIVETMNRAICDGNDNHMFVTLFVGVLNLHTGHLLYCNAGHDAPYLQGAPLPCDSNLPIGVMPDWKFSEQEADITPDSMLFLYTDGLTEAENERYEQFGKQRVTDMVSSSVAEALSPQELVETMTAAANEFVGETEQSDDLTMLAIRFKGDSRLRCIAKGAGVRHQTSHKRTD